MPEEIGNLIGNKKHKFILFLIKKKKSGGEGI
jgi:hypothetical protein